jgi:hypothetical protein
MYLFSRQTRLAGGNGSRGLEWAVEQTARVNALVDIDVQLWAKVYSPGFGTIGWTAWVPDLPTLEAAGDAMQADAGIQAGSDEGAGLTEGGLDDQLLQLIDGTPDPEADPQYVSVVKAVCAVGGIVKGMTAGVEIAQRSTKITGQNGLFGRAVTGPYSGVVWMTGFADAAAMEAATTALSSDPEWPAFLDSATVGAFAEAPELTQAEIWRKLA